MAIKKFKLPYIIVGTLVLAAIAYFSYSFFMLPSSKCSLNSPALCRFANNFDLVNSFQNQTDILGANGVVHNRSVITFIGHNKFRFTTYSNGVEVSDGIQIGKVLYTKNEDRNVWYKGSGGTDEDANFYKMSFTTDWWLKYKYQFVAMEPCGSLWCYHYAFSGEEDGQVWFDNKKFLLRKTSFKGSAVTLVSTTQYEQVKINLPKSTLSSSCLSICPANTLDPAINVVPGQTGPNDPALLRVVPGRSPGF